jgi:CHRD domain/Secretion system C-terminal sorting domain
MKNFYLIFCFALITLTARATTYNLTATLDGTQAGFPAVTATGTFTGTYDNATKLLSYTLTFTGLSGAPTASHFHGNAAPGAGAGVVWDIGAFSSPHIVTNQLLTNIPFMGLANEAGLLNSPVGLWYVNIHTGSFGGGEIRGQVTATAVLGVELNDFVSIKKNSNILLQWKTASETNNKGFEVERSVDGKDFENIGFVKGNGNIKILTTYSFIDKNPLKLNYYRLRQMDYDGKETVSKIVNNTFNGNNKFKIAPNPAKDNLSIYLDENEQSNIVIYDVLGRVVLTKSFFGNLSTFDISSLNTGQYILQILSNNKSYVQQFLKD